MATSPKKPSQTHEQLSEQSTAQTDAQKDRFKAALDAKKAKGGHSGTSHADGGKTGHDHASREGGKREFRRKSGG